MFSFLKKQKWALVKTFKPVRPNSMYVYHVHLFESNKGSRRTEYLCDGRPYDFENSWLQKSDLYQLQIYRWLNGRRDPEIPTYEQIGEEDTANYLKGKVS